MSLIEQTIFIIKLALAVFAMLVISLITSFNDYLSDVLHMAILKYKRLRRRLMRKIGNKA